MLTTRRRFLGASLSAAAVTAFGRDAPPASSTAASADGMTFREPTRDLPLTSDADVIVCGAGPAGVTAAINAARAGARVRLFEAHGALGGVWTNSLLGYLLDFDKPGFNQELVRLLDARDARRIPSLSAMTYEPEEMKVILDELCLEAGIRVQFHTRVVSAHREGRRLATIVTESKSGRQAWRAPVFIDTTGDGDLGALAGCEWEIGQGTSCPCQPMSMCALLVVQDHTTLKSFIHRATAANIEDTKRAFRAEIERGGVKPSYAMPTLFPIRDNLLLAMMNHEYGILAYDAVQISEATMRARAELNRIVRGLRGLGGAWAGIQIVATPEQIGIRDGRRIRGRYTVKRDDVATGAEHADAVVKARFPVDIHAYDRKHAGGAYTSSGVKARPYDIPLRALLARDVDGLMMAGRCISGDYISHASYRVTGNAVAMGEAAGVVAALAAQSRRLPHEVGWREATPVLAKVRRAA